MKKCELNSSLKLRELSNISELHSFLGMVTKLRKLIPHLAEKDKPLRELLLKKNELVWGHTQQNGHQMNHYFGEGQKEGEK